MSDAGWALAGVAIGGLFTGIINYLLQKSQFKHNKEMFVLQNQSTEVVKSLLTEKLSNGSNTDRSFEALKQPIGGYSDDEVRQLLHEIGAMKVLSTDGTEWWYLLSRENERKENREARNV
jgi:hypothetical protein